MANTINMNSSSWRQPSADHCRPESDPHRGVLCGVRRAPWPCLRGRSPAHRHEVPLLLLHFSPCLQVLCQLSKSGFPPGDHCGGWCGQGRGPPPHPHRHPWRLRRRGWGVQAPTKGSKPDKCELVETQVPDITSHHHRAQKPVTKCSH